MCAVSGALSGEILAELKGMSPPTGSYRVIYGLSRAVTPQNGKSMKHEMALGLRIIHRRFVAVVSVAGVSLGQGVCMNYCHWPPAQHCWRFSLT